MGDLDPYVIPTRVLNPYGISIASAVFAGLTSVTDRQTDTHLTKHHFGTSRGAAISCDWEGNRRSGVALAMRDRLQ